MSEHLGTLRTDVTVDIQGARDALRQAAADLRSKAAEMKGEWSGLGASAERAMGSFNSVRASIGFLVGTGGFALMIKSAIDTASALNDVSERTGMSTDAIQAYGFAFKQAGGKQQDFNTNLEIFAKRVGEARKGTGEMVSSMKDNNRELLDSIRKAGSLDDALGIAVDALQNTKDATDRAALATDIFGKSGVKMATLTREAAQEAKNLGLVLSRDMITETDRAGDQLQALGVRLQTVTTRLVLSFVPAITAAIDKMNEWAAAQSKADNARFLKELKEAENVLAGLQEQRRRLAQAGPDRKTWSDEADAVADWNRNLADLDSRIVVQNALVKEGKKLTEEDTTVREKNAGVTDRQVASLDKFNDALIKHQERVESLDAKRNSDNQKAALQVMEDNLTAEQKLAEAVQKLNDLYDDRKLSLDQYNLAVERLTKAYQDQQEAAKGTQDVSRQMGLVMTSTFEETIATMVTAKKAVIDFDAIWRAMAADMIKIALRRQVSDPFLNWMFGKPAGPVTTPFGGVGAQPYAAGGDFPALQPMLVGERGPELIIPRGAGTVVPNHALGGGAQIGPFVNVSRADIPALEAMASRIVAQSQNAAFQRHRRTGR